MKHFVRLLREPLVHFLAIGGLIFLLFTVVSGPASAPIDTIVITNERIEQLAAGFEGAWRRPPSEDEMRAVISAFVREEIYYREALALGLDRNDTIVRRRLQQKMEFLADTGADLLRPAPGELEAYLAANEEMFRRVPRLAFEQLFLGENPGPERVEVSLAAFRSDPATDPFRWSERTLLPARLSLSPPAAIDGVFGEGFFDQLAEIPTGIWTGPVESAYGVHLVRIIDGVPASLPTLEEVREVVLRDWKVAKALELRELHYAKLQERYVVKMPGTEAQKMENR